MTKKEDLFKQGVRYEEILGVDRSQIKERVRRRDESQEGEELLTSTDLFGDIIAGFGPEHEHEGSGSKASSGKPAGAAAPHVAEASPVEAPASRASEPATDTDPYPRSSESYSLLDAAYSTLLKDPNLRREVERQALARGPESGASDAEFEGERSDAPAGDYGQYLLLERVATGGMAEVFRAKRRGVEGFEKVVAVKRILPHLSSNQDFVDMFIAEAKMVASLSHPNIVQIFDLGKIDNTYYIAMEFVEGRDLRSILSRARNRGTVLGVDLAALIAGRVAAALDAAHRHRDQDGVELHIVHRDVSPQNILVSTSGEVKLVDFGIAKAASKASHTDAGSLRGKLLYMSPEQAWGRPLDSRSDLFALGAVFFEMLTGHVLFSGSSDMSVLERVRQAKFLPPSSLNPAVPIELEAIVTRLLRREPEERYQRASDMLSDLETYLRRRPAVGPNEVRDFVARLFDFDGPPEAQNAG